MAEEPKVAAGAHTDRQRPHDTRPPWKMYMVATRRTINARQIVAVVGWYWRRTFAREYSGSGRGNRFSFSRIQGYMKPPPGRVIAITK